MTMRCQRMGQMKPCARLGTRAHSSGVAGAVPRVLAKWRLTHPARPSPCPLTLAGLQQAQIGLLGRGGAWRSGGEGGVGGINFRQLVPPLLQEGRWRGLVGRVPLRPCIRALWGRPRLSLRSIGSRGRHGPTLRRSGVLQFNRSHCWWSSERLQAPSSTGAGGPRAREGEGSLQPGSRRRWRVQMCCNCLHRVPARLDNRQQNAESA